MITRGLCLCICIFCFYACSNQEVCNGNGIFTDEQCICDDGFWGDNCENENRSGLLGKWTQFELICLSDFNPSVHTINELEILPNIDVNIVNIHFDETVVVAEMVGKDSFVFEQNLHAVFPEVERGDGYIEDGVLHFCFEYISFFAICCNVLEKN